MPITTTHGYKKPIVGERGTWWDNINQNTDRIDGHTHNGSDSAAIPARNLSKGTVTLAPGNWVTTIDQAGTFEQTVTLPTDYTLANSSPRFFVDGGDEDGSEVLLSWLKLTSTTFKVYINDSSLAIKVVHA